ncbi:mitochondrial adenine nucleotide transporter ADNT1-like [Zingiber officinale]|uniref:mitochondrial adenine nucleotide transporter ADNT1-like n=1 Tax=Zingiber officinale TaxID=94328 RepID=UPI001C4B9B89|nr:mitochondrial adenine nucleotide transporter ADNT1-like [Zingiber officinale]
MASEDVVGKSTGESAVNTIVNLAEEAKLAREGVKAPGHAILSICKSLVAGGVAGGVSRTAVAPLERLKILLQVQNSRNIQYNGTIQGLKYIWKSEGFRGLFKGNGTNCARIVPNSAVKFFSYEQASSGILWAYRRHSGNENAQLTPVMRLGAGACAGIIAMSATYPMDMVRGRITVQTEKSPRQYQGMFHALGSVYRQEGFRALYRGWLPSVIGVVPYVGLNFAVYESLKDWMLKTNPYGIVKDSELSVITRLSCGAVAGTVGQTIAYPLDVIRRRMQMVGWKDAAPVVTGHGKSKAPLEYNGMVDAFRKTIHNEGFGALYKGLVPNSVKVVPSIAIAFVTYEVVKDVLGVEMRISD